MPEPSSAFESFTQDCIYRAMPWRKAQWTRWLGHHRTNYQAMEQEIAGRLQLDDDEREKLGEVVRKWM